MSLKKPLEDFFENQLKNFLDTCIACGVCVDNCSILDKTILKDENSSHVRGKVNDFLEKDTSLIDEEMVFTRVFSCMECFKCVNDVCPQDLNPMQINEIVKWICSGNNNINNEYQDPSNDNSTQRILASIQVSSEDFEKIFKNREKGNARFVFFPGCNIYSQPEKLLNALDILNLMNIDFVFVPGLDYCCGDVHIFFGHPEKASILMKDLLEKLSSYGPEKVILWCPTCLCRFEEKFSKITNLPFEVVSFPQFVAEHFDELSFEKEINKTATLHEACKKAHMGLDLNGSRKILKNIPGVNLTEMSRIGEKAACCGSGAISFFPESFSEMKNERLKEADTTDADIFVDVCHYCHQVFAKNEEEYNFEIKNFVNLLAEALEMYSLSRPPGSFSRAIF